MNWYNCYRRSFYQAYRLVDSPGRFVIILSSLFFTDLYRVALNTIIIIVYQTRTLRRTYSVITYYY